MLIYAFLVILLLRPSWGLWGAFSVIGAVLAFAAAASQGLTPTEAAFVALIQGVIFCGLGALIVFLRLKFGKGRSRQDNEVDAELARIRTEAAARENEPPPA